MCAQQLGIHILQNIMGHHLVKPIQSKSIHRRGAPTACVLFASARVYSPHNAFVVENGVYRAGACSTQGLRLTMEDQHCMELQDDGVGFFGVFDGHSGPEAARFVAQRLHQHVLAKIDQGQLSPAAVVEAALNVDRELLEAEGVHPDREWGGTTANFAVIVPEDAASNTFRATVGNIGDSRCLLMCVNLRALTQKCCCTS